MLPGRKYFNTWSFDYRFLISDNFSLTCSLWCRFVVSSLSRLCAPQHVNYKANVAWMKLLLRLSRSSQRLRRKFRHSKWLHRLNLMHVKRLIFDHKCRLLTKTTTRQRRRRVTLMQHRALHRNYSVHEHIFQCSRDEPKKCVNKCDMIPIVREPARGGRVRVKKIEDNDLASSVCTKKQSRAVQCRGGDSLKWFMLHSLCVRHTWKKYVAYLTYNWRNWESTVECVMNAVPINTW